MRLRRLGLLFLAVYLLFVGGGTYYSLIFPIRIFHQALMTGLIILWLISRLHNGNGMPATPLNTPLLVACVVWFASVLVSVDPRMALEHLWLPLTHVMMFYVIADLVQRGQQRLVMETQFMLAALVALVAGLQLVSWYFGLGVTPDTAVGWVDVLGPGTWLPLTIVRLWMPLGVSTWLAGYVAPLIVLAGAWALTARYEYRAALWALAGMLTVILVLTFSRGGYFSLAAGIAMFTALYVLQRYQGVLRRFISSRGAVLLTGGAAGLLLVVAVVFVMSRDQSRVAGDTLRLGLWSGAAAIVQDYPVLGVGPGLFGRVYRTYRDPAYVDDRLGTAHNAYLNNTAETGLAGLAVTLWLAFVITRAWWGLYRTADTGGRKLRLAAGYAVLVGMAVQCLFDTFTLTPMVLLVSVLTAYCTVDPSARLRVPFAKPSMRQRMAAAAALLLTLGFGLFWIPTNAAHAQHRTSLNPELGAEAALQASRAAQAADPSFDLYRLQEAYLIGQQAQRGEISPEAGIAAYQQALTIAPTWDTGWINLAALEEQTGNIEAALDALEQARGINSYNLGGLNWARLAEATGKDSEALIVDMYLVGMLADPVFLPLSPFWWETPLRREALEQYATHFEVDIHYRLWAVHDPSRLDALVKENPVSAAEWWVKGEHLLTTVHDRMGAEAAFTQAIALSPRVGDYYASRARAVMNTRPEDALRDLNIAQLLGTHAEFPNAIRAQIATDPAERRRYLIESLPPRAVEQNFEAVSYSRVASFDVAAAMRRPGPGVQALQPWYLLADDYIAAGDVARAVNVYEVIADYAPDETQARTRLAELQADFG